MISTITREQLESISDQGIKLEKIRKIIKGDIKLIEPNGQEFFDIMFPGVKK